MSFIDTLLSAFGLRAKQTPKPHDEYPEGYLNHQQVRPLLRSKQVRPAQATVHRSSTPSKADDADYVHSMNMLNPTNPLSPIHNTTFTVPAPEPTPMCNSSHSSSHSSHSSSDHSSSYSCDTSSSVSSDPSSW